MKKITTIISCLLICLLFVGCSNSKVTLDNTALSTELARDWFLKDKWNEANPVGEMYGEELYAPSLEGKKPETGAYFTLRLPKDEYFNDNIIRTHISNLSKEHTREGSVKVQYGIMNAGIASFASDIVAIVDSQKDVISSKITKFDADIQSEWYAKIDVKKNEDNQVIYAAYLPVIFTYYSNVDVQAIISVVFVPVKTVVATYEVESDVKKYSNDFVTSTLDMVIDWKFSSNVIISNSAK